MAKMSTCSSPVKNPSMELCRFTDPEIVFTYPFPVLTRGFFTLTGLCYIQAMQMVWRVLYTLEHIIEQEDIYIGMCELSQLYNLVSHGSYRYLFKSKPQKSHPILKTTKNDTNWRNQFFFVRRDSIPNGNQLPKKSLVTKERVEAFWKLDPAIRTYPPKSKDLEDISSISYTMSSKFSLTDHQDIASPKSLKKELAASQSNPEPKGMSTRGKGTKRKTPVETSEGLPLMERQLHNYVSEVRIVYHEILLLLRI
ncbi:hypothetical protein Hanom_Chr05g00424381 [Helianthus anomalus]